MLKPIRRVVTGPNPSGASKVIIDDAAPNRNENSRIPGMGVTVLWKSPSVPTDNRGTRDTAGTGFSVHDVPAGVDFIVCEFPPHSEMQKVPESERAVAWLPREMLPDHTRTDTHAHPGMHQHDTTDYITMIAGEITLMLEEGEVTLRAGDTLVQRGSLHAWENRGSVPAILSAAVIGAGRSSGAREA